MEALILGNGPSLNQTFTPDLYNQANIFACNRIFLHPSIKRFAANTTLFLSDISFSDKFESIQPLVGSFRKIFLPLDYNWPSSKNIVRYQLNRSKNKYFPSSCLNNIAKYPNVFESCSVLFTILLPHVLNSYNFHYLKFLGFDGNYTKGRYFYDQRLNNDFRWSKTQESQWELDFKTEIQQFTTHYSDQISLSFS